MLARAEATGVRSSCEASATSCRCAVTERVRASSIVLKARASRPSSSDRRRVGAFAEVAGAGDPLGVVRQASHGSQRRACDGEAQRAGERHGGERDEEEEEPDPRECVVDLGQRPGDLGGRVVVEPCGVDADDGSRRRWRRGRTPDAGLRRRRPPRRSAGGCVPRRGGDLAVPVDELDVARGAAELGGLRGGCRCGGGSGRGRPECGQRARSFLERCVDLADELSADDEVGRGESGAECECEGERGAGGESCAKAHRPGQLLRRT